MKLEIFYKIKIATLAGFFFSMMLPCLNECPILYNKHDIRDF